MSMKKKAMKIRDRARARKENQKDQREKSRPFLCIPKFEKVDIVARYLEKAGFRVVIGTGEKSGDILNGKSEKTGQENSIVYRIPCAVCPKQYVGETGRGLKTRISEHRRDLRNHNLSNAMVIHADKAGHLPRWEHAEILEKGMKKSVRKALEAAHIKTRDTLNTRGGFYAVAEASAKLAVRGTGSATI